MNRLILLFLLLLFSFFDLICIYSLFIFFFNDPATTEIYTLSLHDALPIYRPLLVIRSNLWASGYDVDGTDQTSLGQFSGRVGKECRSEERFSRNAETELVCRLLLEKKNSNPFPYILRAMKRGMVYD